MKAYAKSDLGKARELNEDAYFISADDSEVKIYLLADGMGGYNGGEIASKLAIESARKYITSNFEKISHDKDAIQDLIKSSMEYANMIVYEKSQENKELQGMGTTLEICLVYGNRVYIGHIGDSRVYRIRKDIIRKLTKDHSYVEKLVEDGTITREEAENHPKKNMLMKALGCTVFIEPDVTVKGFLKDDILLMSSDGLTNMIKNQEIYDIVRKDVDKAVDNLVNRANDLGGYDNITVVIIYND